DGPEDFVRVEVTTALARGIPVVPVLVGGTPMPTAGELPPGLEALAYRNAARVDPGRDFHPHVDRLVRELEGLLAGASPAAAGGPNPFPGPAPWLHAPAC